MLNLFDGESDTPELIWDATMRAELRKVTSHQLDECMSARRETGKGNENLSLDPTIRVKYSKLENELFIGGVYVTRFLKEPTYNIRDPNSFLEMLLQRWAHELQMCTESVVTGEEKQSSEIVVGGQDSLQVVTDAIVYLCKVRSTLCEKLSMWGYMSKCLSFLDRILSLELMGTPLLSVMRILHVAVNRRANVESLIASGTNDRLHGIIAFTMRAIGDTNLHPDTGFMLEMLKKVFVDALGDVSKASSMEGRPPPQMASYGRNYAMAPSPAPGEGRVRVNMGDDPLGLGALTPSSVAPVTTQTAGPMNSQPMNNGLVTTSQFSSYNAAQPQPYGAGGQYHQEYHPFHPGPYGSVPNSSQQGVYGSANGGGSFNQSIRTNNGMFGIQQGHQQSMTYGTPSAEIQSQSQPQSQQSRSATTSYAQRSAMAYQTAQHQQGVAAQGMAQSGPSAPIHPVGNPPFASNSGYMGASAPSDRWMGNSNRSHYGVNQSPDIPQQGPPSSSWQNPTQPPQLQPSHQQISTSSAFQGSPIAGIQSNQSESSTSVPIAPSHLPQNQPQHYLSQQTQQFQIPSTPQQPQTQQTQSFPIPTNNGSYNQLQQNQTNFARPTQPDSSGYTAANQQQPQPYQAQYVHPSQLGGAVPILETLTDDTVQNPVSAPAPPVTDGSGIDARTKPQPSVEAAKRAASTQGAPGSAEGRKALLESALHCDLPKFLVESVLENPSLGNVKDPAAVKVHAVELLKLLCQDPGYGLKFKLILEKIPAWKKYASQDHSLFITGHEQKTDYFLTDGSSSDPKKLLTDG